VLRGFSRDVMPAFLNRLEPLTFLNFIRRPTSFDLFWRA